MVLVWSSIRHDRREKSALAIQLLLDVAKTFLIGMVKYHV